MKRCTIFVIVFCGCLLSITQPPAPYKWRLVWSDEFNGANADLDTGGMPLTVVM